MKYLFSVSFLLLFSLLTAYPARAATYHIDSSHTRVIYFISHMGFSNFMGHFNKVTGTVRFNPSHVDDSMIDASIDVRSLSMDDETLDGILQGKDYFNSAAFPAITFKSTKAIKTGPDIGTLTGRLTLHGVTKPVTLDVKFNHKGFNKFAQAAAVGFSATGRILRSDFGMNTLIPVVGDEVTLRIELEAHADSAAVEK